MYSNLNENVDKDTLKKICKKLKKELNENRYIHSVGVAYTAASMAMKYGESVNSALIAGLLHDCAKKYSNDELLNFCKEYKIVPSKAQKASPDLLHGIVGSYMAMDKYKVKDRNILNAIAYHTTGHADMSLLEKIIFIADYIEPARKMIPNLDIIRKLAFEDLDRCIIAVSKGTIEHLKEKKISIDSLTQETLDFYLNEVGE